MLQKGQLQPDKSYRYVCGCGFKNADCPYCCGGNLEKAQEAIKTARGQVYYGLLKTILSHVGKAMVDEVAAIRAKQGGLSVIDVAYVSLKFKLNFKATVEWLEETNAIKPYVYEDFKATRIKVADLYDKAGEKYGAKEQGS